MFVLAFPLHHLWPEEADMASVLLFAFHFESLRRGMTNFTIVSKSSWTEFLAKIVDQVSAIYA